MLCLLVDKRMKIMKIFYVALLLITSACGTTPASINEFPTILPTAIPVTSTPESITEPTNTTEPISSYLFFPRANCCKARTVEAGKYELPSWMEIPLTVEVDEGWGVLNEEAARLFLLAGKGRNEFNDPSQVMVFIAIPNGDPQDVLTSIQNAPELMSVGEITETTIAGFSGWQFDAVAKPNPGNEGKPEDGIPPGSQTLPSVGRYFTPGFLWTTWTAEPHMRFIALNAGEQVLLFVIESPPAKFEAFTSKSHGVLETLMLRK
jgi:hypothetical protein